MSEKKGGSDVSDSTETVAVEYNENKFRLYGYKWFSSATDCHVSLALARVIPFRAKLTLEVINLKHTYEGILFTMSDWIRMWRRFRSHSFWLSSARKINNLMALKLLDSRIKWVQNNYQQRNFFWKVLVHSLYLHLDRESNIYLKCLISQEPTMQHCNNYWSYFIIYIGKGNIEKLFILVWKIF